MSFFIIFFSLKGTQFFVKRFLKRDAPFCETLEKLVRNLSLKFYVKNSCLFLGLMLYCFLSVKWPIGQAVKTRPSQGRIMGSIPVWVTKNKKDLSKNLSLFCCHFCSSSNGNSIIGRHLDTHFKTLERKLSSFKHSIKNL